MSPRAIDNLLLAAGVVDALVLGDGVKAAEPMQILSLARQTQAIYATRRGWFEPATSLSAIGRGGDLDGSMHDLERLDAPKEGLRFAEGRVLISQRLHTYCEAGDCLVQLAEPIEA